MEQITLDELVIGMNQYATTIAPKMHEKLQEEAEWETDTSRYRPTEKSYIEPSISIGELLQPYQVAFTPGNGSVQKGKLQISGVENFIQEGKVDLQYTMKDVDIFANTQLYMMRELGQDIDIQPILKAIFDKYISKQLFLDFNRVAWSGIRVEPTEGEASPMLDTFTGFKKRIDDAANAGKITEIATGAITPQNIFDKVQTLCMGVPASHRLAPGTIRMSATRALQYAQAVEEKYGNTAKFSDNKDGYYQVPFMNKRIKPMTSMEGSDRMWLELDGKESWAVGVPMRGNMMPRFRFQKFDRTMKCFAETGRWYGFTFYDFVFVNDQA